MSRKILLALAAVSGSAEARGQLGWCFDVNGLASEFKEIKGTNNWPEAYTFSLQTGDTCWVQAKQSSYITWRFNEQVTITVEKYTFDESDPEKCVPKKNSQKDYYAKNTIEYTARSPWPYNEDNVCATYFEITNNDTDRESDVNYYTFPEGYSEDPTPVGALSLSAAAALAASFLSLMAF